MSDNTILGFTTNMLLIGLFLVAMISGYFLIVHGEGQSDILEGYEVFQNISNDLSGELSENATLLANQNMNLSATYDPELTISAADQVSTAVSLNMLEVGKVMWTSIGQFFTIIFGSVFGKTISAIIFMLIIFSVSYYSIKWIRSGI